MRGRIKIASVRDVPVNLHWTFLLFMAIVGVGIYLVSDLMVALYAVGMVGLIFFIVLMHELAHVAVGRRYGVPTREITLHPLGGISMMERMPEKPKQEAAVSAAGPLVNVILAILFVPLVWHFHGAAALYRFRLVRIDDLSFFLDLYWINIIMAVFNLLPAFPLDGGRVLRASLAIKMSYVRATKVAADMGRFFGILFVLAGLFIPGAILLSLIGVFVYFGASAEERSATTMALFSNSNVGEAMRKEFHTVDPQTPITELVELSYRSHQMDLPVVAGGEYRGIVDRNTMSSAVGMEDKTAEDIMRSDTPVLTETDDLATAFRHFSNSRVKALPVMAPRLSGLGTADEVASAQLEGKTAEGKTSWAKVPGHPTTGGRMVGLLTIEDMERAYLYITQRERVGRDTRIASPIDFSPKRRLPRGQGTRVRREPSGDAEEWVPVGRK